MEKSSLLLEYFDKQLLVTRKIYNKILPIDISNYANRYVFSLQTQQCYTALENLFKYISHSFEGHVEEMISFEEEILGRMETNVPNIRPPVISKESHRLLDKLRAFRHFIRHAYDCELEEQELQMIQKRLKEEFGHVKKDLETFRSFIAALA